MNKALAALVLAAWAVSPVLAEDVTPQNVNAITCSQFTAMETPEKRDVSYHVLNWINDAKNAVAAQKLIGKYDDQSWTPEKMLIEIEGHCKDGSVDINIVDRLIEHT